jgi:hypothetical protein
MSDEKPADVLSKVLSYVDSPFKLFALLVMAVFAFSGYFVWQNQELLMGAYKESKKMPSIVEDRVEDAAAHLLKTTNELTYTLLEHYLHYGLGQLYKIVFSLDLVGSPYGLLQSLGVGVKDFFFEPAHALITNPNDLRKIGSVVVKGTISIISNTTVRVKKTLYLNYVVDLFYVCLFDVGWFYWDRYDSNSILRQKRCQDYHGSVLHADKRNAASSSTRYYRGRASTAKGRWQWIILRSCRARQSPLQ